MGKEMTKMFVSLAFCMALTVACSSPLRLAAKRLSTNCEQAHVLEVARLTMVKEIGSDSLTVLVEPLLATEPMLRNQCPSLPQTVAQMLTQQTEATCRVEWLANVDTVSEAELLESSQNTSPQQLVEVLKARHPRGLIQLGDPVFNEAGDRAFLIATRRVVALYRGSAEILMIDPRTYELSKYGSSWKVVRRYVANVDGC